MSAAVVGQTFTLGGVGRVSLFIIAANILFLFMFKFSQHYFNSMLVCNASNCNVQTIGKEILCV